MEGEPRDWKGVDLAGLCVAAAVQSDTTFSEDDRPEKRRAVLIVDAQATPGSASALVDMARTFGGSGSGRTPVVETTRMQPEAGRPA